MDQLKQPKYLIFDIETAPKLAYVWGRWNQNIAMSQLKQDFYLLSWAAKWLDDEYVYSDALYRHKDVYRADPTDDSAILETAWDMLNEADYVIAHNGKSFDRKIINARFIQAGMKPPSPYIVLDTLTMARSHFKFTSNRLDDLGKFLGLGEKLDTGGMSLWIEIVEKKCLKAFKRLVEYNENDVVLNEVVYQRLAAWDDKQPAKGTSSKRLCNACGSSQTRNLGIAHTLLQSYRRIRCYTCGHWMRERVAIKQDKKTKKNRPRSA